MDRILQLQEIFTLDQLQTQSCRCGCRLTSSPTPSHVFISIGNCTLEVINRWLFETDDDSKVIRMNVKPVSLRLLQGLRSVLKVRDGLEETSDLLLHIHEQLSHLALENITITSSGSRALIEQYFVKDVTTAFADVGFVVEYSTTGIKFHYSVDRLGLHVCKYEGQQSVLGLMCHKLISDYS